MSSNNIVRKIVAMTLQTPISVKQAIENEQ
jgi:hypothetical protein